MISMHVILAVAGYFFFSAAVGALPEPLPAQQRRFYGWFYRFSQSLAANADRLAAVRFPGIVHPATQETGTLSIRTASVTESRVTDARTTP